MVDYSRFAHIGSDDSSDDDAAPSRPAAIPVDANGTRVLQPVTAGGDYSQSPRAGSFVKLHDKDTGAGLRDVFLEEDPRTFRPVARAPSGAVAFWGLPEQDMGMEGMMRQMQTQFFYFTQETPEQQFVNVLVERKRAALAASRDAAAQGRDLVVRVALAEHPRWGKDFEELDPPVWRRLRVSGRTNLRVLHDRILGPVVGWTRNYHAFFFTDFADGALWCPIDESSAIDMMHVKTHVIAALKPSETALGELLRAPGDKIGYTYDLGDMFEHTVVLEEIVDAEASTGAVAVLDGAMRCPNEDGNGNARYQEEVLDPYLACGGAVGDLPPRFAVGRRVECNMGTEPAEHRFGPPKTIYRAGTVVASPYFQDGRSFPYQVRLDSDDCLIYCPEDHDDWVKALGKGPPEPAAIAERRTLWVACRARCGAMNVPSGDFDPAEFDLGACRATLREAIASRASAQEGSKIFHVPFSSDDDGTDFGMPPAPGRAQHKGGQAGARFSSELSETVSTRPDRPEERICANCGNPAAPKTCSKCKTTHYCSKDCQSAHWKAGHKRECAKYAEERDAYKADKKANKRAVQARRPGRA